MVVGRTKARHRSPPRRPVVEAPQFERPQHDELLSLERSGQVLLDIDFGAAAGGPNEKCLGLFTDIEGSTRLLERLGVRCLWH